MTDEDTDPDDIARHQPHPSDVEALPDEFVEPESHDEFSIGDDTCPECGSDSLYSETSERVDPDNDKEPVTSEVTYVKCEACGEVLYEHPVSQLDQFFGGWPGV